MSGDVIPTLVYSAAVCEQEVLTFVSDDLGGLEEEASMLQVHHLSLQTILHHIDQSQLITQVLSRGGRKGQKSVCDCGGWEVTFSLGFGVLLSNFQSHPLFVWRVFEF